MVKLYQASDIHEPFVINSEGGSERGYRTKDLVVRHPTKPDLWKMYAYTHSFLITPYPHEGHSISVGRLDDQIVLLNGEKTNPIPMGEWLSLFRRN